MTGLSIDTYEWTGGREAMLRVGPRDGPMVVVAPALFEEANRTRAFTVALARALAARGIGVAIPDLPGQGESSVPTEQARLADWRQAFAAAARHVAEAPYGIALRAGATVDGDARLAGRWRLSPIAGRAALRDLQRASVAAGARWDQFGPGNEPITLAGNRIAFPLYAALLDDSDLPPAGPPIRTVRLDSDPAAAERRVPGPPLWRRSEPDSDAALALALAADIADWIAACAG